MQQRKRKLAAGQRAVDACVRGVPLLVDGLGCRPWLLSPSRIEKELKGLEVF